MTTLRRVILAEAKSRQRRLSRVLIRAALQLREQVLLNDLAIAVAGRDVRRARAVVKRADIASSLTATESVVSDAVVRGGLVTGSQGFPQAAAP